MRTITLVLIAALCALWAGVAFPQVDPAAEQEMVRLVNAERAKAGLAPLTVDERLTRIAREHSQLQATKHAISHQFPGEPDVRHRISPTGLRFNYSGENVAFDVDPPSAHRELMNSPPHRANILRPEFNAIGIGVVHAGNEIYVTEDFARRLPELSPDDAESAIVRSFAALRRSVGLRPVPLRSQDGLRELACQMAKNGRLETDIARDIPNVSTVTAWTATEPQKLPSDLIKLKNARASGWSLGSCFAPSPRFPNPVWWNVAVMHF